MKTIGERIRFFRKDRKITQDKLAEMTGIHPVSIRKYETNKMQPQAEQIERIAVALEINASALWGYNGMPMQMKTYGDFYGLIMQLFRARVIMAMFPAVNDGRFVSKEHVDKTMFMLNPAIADLFDTVLIAEGDGVKRKVEPFMHLQEVGLMLKDAATARDISIWAVTYVGLEELRRRESEEGTDEISHQKIEELGNMLEDVELRLLSDTTPLSTELPEGSKLREYGEDTELTLAFRYTMPKFMRRKKDEE